MEDRNNKSLSFLAGGLLSVGVLATALPNLISRLAGLPEGLRDGLITVGWIALLASMMLLVVLARRVSLEPVDSPATTTAASAAPLRTSR